MFGISPTLSPTALGLLICQRLSAAPKCRISSTPPSAGLSPCWSECVSCCFPVVQLKGFLSQLSVPLLLNQVAHCWGWLVSCCFSCGVTSLVNFSVHSLSTSTSPCIVNFAAHGNACGLFSVRINLVRGAKGIHNQIVDQHVAESPSAFPCCNVVGLHLFAQSVNQRDPTSGSSKVGLFFHLLNMSKEVSPWS